MEGKAQKVTQALYFTYLLESLLQTDFHQILYIVRYADVIICANFVVEKLMGLGYTGGGQILESPIEMAGHPYNIAACDRKLTAT